MKEQVLFLVELQRIDSEMKKIQARGGYLPVELERLTTELHDFEQTVAEERKKLDDLMAELNEKEKKLKRGQESLTKTKSRQFEVKTNKEYHALLAEIDAITARNDESENEIIGILEMIDAVKKELDDAEQCGKAFREEQEKKIAGIQSEMDSIDSLLLEIRNQYDAMKKKIAGDLLRRYDVIKQKRNNRAVVPVWREICGGCHMNIPPQMYNELQRSENLMLCPHCNRIIYWDNRENGQS